MAAERAEAEPSSRGKTIVEERYQAHPKRNEAKKRQRARKPKLNKKAKSELKRLNVSKEQQENARRRAELARQQIEAERKAAQAAKTGPSSVNSMMAMRIP